MTVIMVCVVTVMLLIWLLLGSWIGYCSAGIWVIYTGAKSGCKLVTLFGGYSYDGVSAGIWVIHTEVPNLGARWSRFLAVTLMMV